MIVYEMRLLAEFNDLIDATLFGDEFFCENSFMRGD